MELGKARRIVWGIIDDVRTFWEGIVVPVLVLAGIAGGLLGGLLFLVLFLVWLVGG